ncbi:MAG: hypothetical protein PHO10_11300 [Gemmiger sp.]|nr:hypothetical protein [Gemmiger sp.]
MNQLQNLNAQYLAMAAENPARTATDFEKIVEYMKGSSAIHHGEYVRTCFIPKIFTAENFEFFRSEIKTLYGIFQKVMDAYYADAGYRALFGFPPELEALILRSDHTLSLLPMARIDFFYNEATGDYKFCEFNTDGTSAMNEDRELHLAQSLSRVYRAFSAEHAGYPCELFDSWADAFLKIYRRAKGADATPHAAIVDYMECGTANEFEEFQHHFIAKGIPTVVCDVRQLQFDGTTLTGPDGQVIDAIYRRAVTSDVLHHYEESTALLDAVRAGAVLLLGDFHTQLVHNKTIFRILQHPATFALLQADEIAYIRAHVPFTTTLAEADWDEVAANKDRWILKPQDSYGSKGIHAGVENDEESWRKLVYSVDRQDYLLQEFYMPYQTENYGLAGDAFGKHSYYNLTGIYVYDGVAQGVYSRVSLSPIISSQYSEKTLPTLLVQG